jgi:uncharacterized RDD family membrane protein YckC
VTKTCSQCGAVLPSGVQACNFCDSSFSVGPSIWEDIPDISAREILEGAGANSAGVGHSNPIASVSHQLGEDAAWRGELSQRLEAYRRRRKKLTRNAAQSQFAFENPSGKERLTSVVVAESRASVEEDFSFTIAIGRPSKKQVLEESRMEIDVSLPPDSETGRRVQAAEEKRECLPGLHPLASMDDRRLAALIDFLCLLFAYGGFLTLFGSLGGQFTMSKLSAAVYASTFAIVYLQYFALFTVFGGTTPGMMMRSLEVVSFSGEPPTPRQMLLRSAGYILSAGTFFLGFFWAMWDEDELTWHDRLSRTHLSAAQTFADIESSTAAHSR